MYYVSGTGLGNRILEVNKTTPMTSKRTHSCMRWENWPHYTAVNNTRLNSESVGKGELGLVDRVSLSKWADIWNKCSEMKGTELEQ